MAGVTTTSTVAEFHQLASDIDLVGTLECPVCLEIPLPPIYICKNGHNICGSCKFGMGACGLCNAEYTNTRNFAVESIVNRSQFKCKYSLEGCNEILKGEACVTHFKSCSFGPISCFEQMKNRCSGTLVPSKNFLNHLKQHHIARENIYPSRSTEIAMTICSSDLTQDRNFPCYIMHYDEEIFLSNIRTRNGVIYWWVTTLSSQAEKYTAKLILLKKAFKRAKLEWTFPVHSVRKTVSTILESGFCGAMPCANMSSFFKPEGNVSHKTISWSFTYEIEKIKIE